MASGLDIESANTVIDWDRYLDLYCIFEAGKIEPSTLIRFWIKFFDSSMRGTVPKEEYMKVLEQLVRGSTLDKPSDTTRMFAQMFQTMMDKAGCLDNDKNIINEKLSEAFKTEKIDI